MNKLYVVTLSAGERSELVELTRRGRAAAGQLLHARILLKADAEGSGWTDARIAEALDTNTRRVERVRRRFVEEGLAAALARKPHANPTKPLLDGVAEARLVALACSQPPKGHARWTVRLLADKLVSLDVVEHVSRETVRRKLKKMICGPGA